MRLLLLFLTLAVLVVVGFVLWGDSMESRFTVSGSQEWIQARGNRAWLAAVFLLASDIILPIPATVVFTALGMIYGPWMGGILGTLGFSLGGTIAYLLCLGCGEKAARLILGEKDFERGHRLFGKSGGWIVAASRWLPVLPEVIACMAGLTRMPSGKFFAALICGSAPPAFAFAILGHAGKDQPLIALGISAVAAPLLWLIVGKRLHQ